jgi:transaldolase
MKIFLDTADVDMIGPAYSTGLIDGVTTNPTLIMKSGRDPVEVIKEISTSFKTLQSISAEVVADTAEEMIEQAQAFNGLWNVTIKVPCTVEGLKACRALSSQGQHVNVTLIFSVAQAILAEKAGATYVSPFVGRWFDNSVDGIELIKNIRQAYTGQGQLCLTNILAASCVIPGTNAKLITEYPSPVVVLLPPAAGV